MSNKNRKHLQFHHSAETREGRVERAVAIMCDPQGFMQEKWQFLKGKGMSDAEILEALNIASNGEVLRATGLVEPGVAGEPEAKGNSGRLLLRRR